MVVSQYGCQQRLPSVITSLEREAEEQSNAEAAGPAKIVKTYKFVAALYMFSDVLSQLSGLISRFSKHDIDFSSEATSCRYKAITDALRLVPSL